MFSFPLKQLWNRIFDKFTYRSGREILEFYPNPADDKIYIRSSSSAIRWFDPLGQELFPKQDIDGGWMVSAFSSGIYVTYVENRCFKWVKR